MLLQANYDYNCFLFRKFEVQNERELAKKFEAFDFRRFSFQFIMQITKNFLIKCYTKNTQKDEFKTV